MWPSGRPWVAALPIMRTDPGQGTIRRRAGSGRAGVICRAVGESGKLADPDIGLEFQTPYTDRGSVITTNPAGSLSIDFGGIGRDRPTDTEHGVPARAVAGGRSERGPIASR